MSQDISALAIQPGYHFVSWMAEPSSNATFDNTSLAKTSVTLSGDATVTASFAINTYTLSYSAGANGSLQGETAQTVNHGGSGTSITAIPATWYHFVSWSDGSTINPRTDTNVMANIAVQASFAIDTFTLSYTAGTNGSLIGETSQIVSYAASGTAVTASPALGYRFVSWSDGSTINPRTDSNVIGNLSVVANFAVKTYTLDYTSGANGKLKGQVSQIVNYRGSGTAVIAIPDTGYHFSAWSDGSTANPRSESQVTANLTVTANFAINTYTLAYDVTGANGTLKGETMQTVTHGASGTAVTANPYIHYHFVAWSDGSTANPRIDENVTANVAVSASFAIDTYTLDYTSGANGHLTGKTSQIVNHTGSGLPVTAVPAQGYHFTSWSDGSIANPRTDKDVTANVAVMASFAINTYTLTYTAEANGTLEGEVSQTLNNGGAGSAVTAKPNVNFHFTSWSDGSTENPRTDTNVMANVAVTAMFALDTFELTYSAGPHGSLTGATNQTVGYGLSGDAVTAVPATGYHFLSWSDNSTENPRTDSNVTANIAVTASFAIDTHTVSFTAGSYGVIQGISPQTIDYGANCSAVSAVPDAHHHFVGWTGDYSGANNPLTITSVTKDMVIAASFAIDTFTLVYSAETHGSLTGTISQTVNYSSNGSAITAVPSLGYHFVNWSDGSIANPRTDTNVTANIAVTANFAINAYSLTYAAGANGSLSGETSQTVNHGSSGSAVAAVPAAGYHFASWSDGATANPRTDTNVTTNVSVTASFAINAYTLTYAAGANGSLSGGNLSDRQPWELWLRCGRSPSRRLSFHVLERRLH